MSCIHLSGANRTQYRSFILCVMISCATTLISTPIYSASLKLDDEPYNYVIIDQDLRDVFNQFGNHMHLRINLSDAVKGRVRGKVPVMSPQHFLEKITSDYGLDWYYDGFRLYVTASSEGVSKVISVPRDLSATFRTALDAAEITDPRFPLRELAGTDNIIVSGPPRFVELVEQTASALAPGKSPAAGSPATPPASPNYVVIYRGGASQKTEFPRTGPAAR